MIEKYFTFKYYEEVGGLAFLGIALVITVVFLIVAQIVEWWKKK